jgi:hypothetical protein
MNRLIAIAGLLAVSCSGALAGITDLGTEMPAFTGVREFRATYSNGTHLDVNVDFAVFGPGGATATSLAFAPHQAPNNGEYIYAYQLHSLSSSTVPLTFFTIDLLADAGVSGVGYNNSEGVRNATSATLRPDFIRYNFTAKQLKVSETSFFLVYSSPNPPIWSNASIIDGGTSQTIPDGLPAPGPIPAPGAVVLGMLGLAGLKAARRAYA